MTFCFAGAIEGFNGFNSLGLQDKYPEEFLSKLGIANNFGRCLRESFDAEWKQRIWYQKYPEEALASSLYQGLNNAVGQVFGLKFKEFELSRRAEYPSGIASVVTHNPITFGVGSATSGDISLCGRRGDRFSLWNDPSIVDKHDMQRKRVGGDQSRIASYRAPFLGNIQGQVGDYCYTTSHKGNAYEEVVAYTDGFKNGGKGEVQAALLSSAPRQALVQVLNYKHSHSLRGDDASYLRLHN